MRTTEQRKRDAIAKLEGDMDVWVATADDHENAHLVSLSLCWHNEEVVVATKARGRTAQNAERTGQARLALGPSRDVVIIDAAAYVVDIVDADPLIKKAYRERTGWGPGGEGLHAVMSRDAGLPRIGRHDLPHSYATAALGAGILGKFVSERLGHASIAVTLDTYSHVLPALQEDGRTWSQT